MRLFSQLGIPNQSANGNHDDGASSWNLNPGMNVRLSSHGGAS